MNPYNYLKASLFLTRQENVSKPFNEMKGYNKRTKKPYNPQIKIIVIATIVNITR